MRLLIYTCLSHMFYLLYIQNHYQVELKLYIQGIFHSVDMFYNLFYMLRIDTHLMYNLMDMMEYIGLHYLPQDLEHS